MEEQRLKSLAGDICRSARKAQRAFDYGDKKAAEKWMSCITKIILRHFI